jgi:archaemetzincin
LINTEHQKVIISPIGKRDNELIESIAADIESVFGHKTEEILLLDSVDFAFDPARRQYHSTPILEKLAALAPSQAVKVLGIVEYDLFIPILTHVYGEAQLGGKACMVSTYRLKEGLSLAGSRDAYQQRVVKEAVHELGHTFNLRHCRDSACIMHYCRTVEDVDRKTGRLCRYCKILLKDELEIFFKS